MTDTSTGVRKDFTSADLTVENIPTADGALILGTESGKPGYYGFRLVNGESYGIVSPRTWTVAEVVSRAKQSRYDVVIDGIG